MVLSHPKSRNFVRCICAQFLLLLLVVNPLFLKAYHLKPATFGDYQRSDFAKNKVKKVIYFFDNIENKKKDTLSVKTYNSEGFLCAFDSFAVGFDNVYRLVLSQTMTYEIQKTEKRIQVKELKLNGQGKDASDITFVFDTNDRLISRITIADQDTLTDQYTYDDKGACISHRFHTKYIKDFIITATYTYMNGLVVKETYTRAEVQKVYNYEYDANGQLTRILKDNGDSERYTYNAKRQLIRLERECPGIAEAVAYGEIFKYTYNAAGKLVSSEYEMINCDPVKKTELTFKEMYQYTPEGLPKDRCIGECFRFVYIK